MEKMLLPLQRYAEFSGRSSRSEYWLFALFQILVLIGLFAISAVFGAFEGEAEPMSTLGGIALFVIIIGYFLVFFIPGIAVTVRRWHDLDQSGWFVLLFAVLGVIPFIGALSGIANLVWFCLPGTSGPNQYGEDPLAE